MPILLPNPDSVKEMMEDGDAARKRVMAIAFSNRGHIIAKSINKAIFGRPDKFSLHAEHLLVNKLSKIRAKERFGKVFVMVLRWSKQKQDWTMAMPCEDCRSRLFSYGVCGVYYSDENGEFRKLQQENHL
jgi:hypothetical protein